MTFLRSSITRAAPLTRPSAISDLFLWRAPETREWHRMLSLSRYTADPPASASAQRASFHRDFVSVLTPLVYAEIYYLDDYR